MCEASSKEKWGGGSVWAEFTARLNPTVSGVHTALPAGHLGSRYHRWSGSPGWSRMTSVSDRWPSPPARNRPGMRWGPACHRVTTWSHWPIKTKHNKRLYLVAGCLLYKTYTALTTTHTHTHTNTARTWLYGYTMSLVGTALWKWQHALFRHGFQCSAPSFDQPTAHKSDFSYY